MTFSYFSKISGYKSHPHIVLNDIKHGDVEVVLAPIMHNLSDHLKPHMPVPLNDHGLKSVTRLDHIVAHPNVIQKSFGKFSEKAMSDKAVEWIKQDMPVLWNSLLHIKLIKCTLSGKELVKAHWNATHQHGLAAQKHQDLVTHHDNQAALHKTGNTQLSDRHASQAALHCGHAKAHKASAKHHHDAAKDVNSPNHAELKHTQESKCSAHKAHKKSTSAAKHCQNHSLDATDMTHNNAISHSQTAVHHTNQATAHVH